MTTAAEKTNNALAQIRTRQAFCRAFMDRLGDPRQWEATGEVRDLQKPEGTCICGHAIRYEYVIQHLTAGHLAHVGSECINHFQELNPDLWAALERARLEFEEKVKAQEKAARSARQQAAVAAAAEGWEKARATARAYMAVWNKKDGRYWKPSWFFRVAPLLRESPRYQSAHGFISYYERTTQAILRILDGAEFWVKEAVQSMEIQNAN